jgi:hypothetical protein
MLSPPFLDSAFLQPFDHIPESWQLLRQGSNNLLPTTRSFLLKGVLTDEFTHTPVEQNQGKVHPAGRKMFDAPTERV